MSVRAKKHLGQHFLKDESICIRIADEIKCEKPFSKALEIGPGMGALTKFLLKKTDFDTEVIELDEESVEYLSDNYPQLAGKIHYADFLKTDLTNLMGTEPFAVVGNFPYNISSQILFKILDYKDQVPLAVGMFQKEVAERVAEGPGSKRYGIISVLLQAFYDVEYLFTVDENVFSPPPKVKSGVIRLIRNDVEKLDCDHKLFVQLVKMAFGQRRKTLRNSLKPLINRTSGKVNKDQEIFSRRPETLSVQEFIELTKQFQAHI
ncbi:MAG: 16S rRNA (adenine(1518)-N(6)/adenine(1519)-N(6))-dimethyltransferase RsmA [Flavobacteriales bacterium]|jgi:16S rRNA (adenine1518-N6/adenine1519-N6)-dimethyltransferase|nr:16S rRNA (adenine(1518)-N(6)/adenine(1519)-N(6))-dimethyltransferase RsmA [Flavobacteriales bacterium]